MSEDQGRIEWIQRWLDRLFKTDVSYLFSGGFWLLFGQGITMFASLGLAVAFANLIEPEKYGNYKYILTLASIISAFTLTGLTTAVTRAAARGHDGTLNYSFRRSLMWSAGMIIIAALGAAYYFIQGNIFLGTSLIFVGATSPLTAAASLYRPFLMGKKEFRRASISGIVQSATPTLSVLAAILLQAQLTILVGVYFVTTAFVMYGLYQYSIRLTKNSSIDPYTDHLGKHLSIISVISTVVRNLDSILVFQLLGGAQLAVFTLATTIPDTIRGSLKHIDTLAMPKFALKSKEELKRAVLSKTSNIFLATTVIAAIYAVTAPLLFSFFFPQYLSAISLSQVYAFIIPMSFVLSAAYFDTQAVVRERYILSAVNNMNRIVFTLVGIYFWGLWGAVVARLAARAIVVALTFFFVARH